MLPGPTLIADTGEVGVLNLRAHLRLPPPPAGMTRCAACGQTFPLVEGCDEWHTCPRCRDQRRAVRAAWERYQIDLRTWQAREYLRQTTMQIWSYVPPPAPPIEPAPVSSPRWAYRA
jgi:hypothetical protein